MKKTKQEMEQTLYLNTNIMETLQFSKFYGLIFFIELFPYEDATKSLSKFMKRSWIDDVTRAHLQDTSGRSLPQTKPSTPRDVTERRKKTDLRVLK